MVGGFSLSGIISLMATNDFDDYMARFEALMDEAHWHGIESVVLLGEHDPIGKRYATGWHCEMNPYTALGLLGTVGCEIQESVLGGTEVDSRDD